MITIENIHKTYKTGNGEIQALRGVSLDIEKGEFLSLAGPSGSGKTTLLNIVGCIDSADMGDVVFAGQSVSKLKSDDQAAFRRDHLGFVFQSYNLIPVLTAFENVAFGLTLMGVDEKETRERTMESLEEVGLADMSNRRPGRLSGGQQQRVAIARAIVKRPAILLADEPTANLDSTTSREILDLMKALNERHQCTCIFSTHDPLVMDFAKRLIKLHDGLITSDEEQRSGE